jgi:serine O-acetyltransferase
MLSQLRCLIADLDVYAYRCGKGKWAIPLMPIIYPQCWANIHYRFTRAIVYHFRIPILKQLLLFLGFFMGRFIKMSTGVEIHYSADIGPGLYIAHIGSIIIAMRTIIGKNASIHQEVTFGGPGKDVGESGGFPVVGDNVYVGAGAKIIGNVKIGNDVMIGCNAVVVKDIPDHATAVGMPARVVNMDGSVGAIHVRPRRGAK